MGDGHDKMRKLQYTQAQPKEVAPQQKHQSSVPHDNFAPQLHLYLGIPRVSLGHPIGTPAQQAQEAVCMLI